MSRLNLFIVILVALTLLPASTSVSAQIPDVQPATNGIYDIFVQNTGSYKGTYTIRTGTNHPLTLSMGSSQSVLYGGSNSSPRTSFNTIRSYTSNTDYAAGPYHTSDFAVVNLDAYTTGTVVIGSNELQTIWDLPGPPTTPDKLEIFQNIRVEGNNFSNSYIVVTISVTNLSVNPVSLGVRYFWDTEIGNDDGPTFTQVNQDGTIGATLTKETEFQLPAFESFFIQDNDRNTNPPIFGVHGTVTGPSSFLPSAPGNLQFVCWMDAFGTAFNFVVDPNKDIATTASPCGGSRGGDSAVAYIFGSDAANAISIDGQQTFSLSADIFAAPADGDIDEDGLLNSWETNDTDLNADGKIDVGPSIGSDPNKKDIYVEVDWMEATGLFHAAHKPKPEAIEKVVDAFAAQNINLHVDVGPDSIDYVTGNTWGQNSNGNEFAHEDWIGDSSNDDELKDDWNALKSANFGHSDRVFHQALFVHKATSLKYEGRPIGGLGQTPGQYFFISLGGYKGRVGSLNEQAGVFMHELGHNLGLQHGGNEGDDPNTIEKDDFNYKPNYLSVMNYVFNTSGLTINGNDGNMDYSRFDLPDLDEDNLIESSNGLNDTRVAGYKTKYYANGICNIFGSSLYRATPADQPINWDCDLTIDSQPVQADINGKSGNAQLLTGWDDWAHLIFKAGNIGLPVAAGPIPITIEDIVNGPRELTFEEDLRIQRISDPRVQLTEVADVSTVQAGGTVSYTITMLNIDGQDTNDVVITETIPAGFNYVPGSTSGATTTDPVIDGQNLSWSSFIVPANGDMLTLSFQVAASQIPGIYSNAMSGSSSNGYVVSVGDTAQVEVIPSSNFPSTPVLDNFNRANGVIGSNWSGYTSKYHVTSNQMTVDYNGSNSDIYWKNVSFGADQESYVTFTDIDATSSEHDLLLKAQSNTTWGDGVIEVLYDPMGHITQVWTYEWPDEWVQHGADIPVTFVDGDTFGARALVNGTVEVYKNGTLLATRDITAWSHYAGGGYIGLWFIGAEDAILDDFGGGTISGGTAPMSMLSGSTESEDLTAEQLNVNVQDAVIYWQGMPIGSNQPANVTFTNIPANKQSLLLKPQSNGMWGEGVVEVLYDVIGGRIQVWVYDAQTGKGWVQYGKDIPVKFAAGDTFSVQVLADGTVEIQRNGKLLAKRDVTP